MKEGFRKKLIFSVKNRVEEKIGRELTKYECNDLIAKINESIKELPENIEMNGVMRGIRSIDDAINLDKINFLEFSLTPKLKSSKKTEIDIMSDVDSFDYYIKVNLKQCQMTQNFLKKVQEETIKVVEEFLETRYGDLEIEVTLKDFESLNPANKKELQKEIIKLQRE